MLISSVSPQLRHSKAAIFTASIESSLQFIVGTIKNHPKNKATKRQQQDLFQRIISNHLLIHLHHQNKNERMKIKLYIISPARPVRLEMISCQKKGLRLRTLLLNYRFIVLLTASDTNNL